jgi:hypothetical protein
MQMTNTVLDHTVRVLVAIADRWLPPEAVLRFFPMSASIAQRYFAGLLNANTVLCILQLQVSLRMWSLEQTLDSQLSRCLPSHSKAEVVPAV